MAVLNVSERKKDGLLGKKTKFDIILVTSLQGCLCRHTKLCHRNDQPISLEGSRVLLSQFYHLDCVKCF